MAARRGVRYAPRSSQGHSVNGPLHLMISLPQQSGLLKGMSVVILLTTVVPFYRQKMRGKTCQLSDNRSYKVVKMLNDCRLI